MLINKEYSVWLRKVLKGSSHESYTFNKPFKISMYRPYFLRGVPVHAAARRWYEEFVYGPNKKPAPIPRWVQTTLDL